MSSLIDLSCAVDGCSLPIEVIRFLPPVKAKGRPISSSEESRFDAMMSVQPMGQKQLQRLPEGLRSEGAVRGFTTCALMTVSTSECRRADHFICNDVEYEVQLVEDWSQMGNYYEITATRVNR